MAETPLQLTQEEVAIISASRLLGTSPSGQPWGLVVMVALAGIQRGGYGVLTVKVHRNEIRECIKSESVRAVDAA